MDSLPVSERPKYVLAIDLGTSALKMALVSLDGEIAGSATEPMSVTLLPGGGAEQSPDHWWNAILRTSRALLAKHPELADDVVAVSASAQWSGTVAVDREGNHVAPAVIWMDSRGEPYVKRITGGWIQVEGYGLSRLWKWVRLTGGAPGHAGKDPIAHILFLKYERPEVYARTYKFLEPKDYLNLRLTGRFAASYDSIILHWVTDNRNLSRIAYQDGLLKLAGIERSKLPDLQRAIDVLGPIKPEVARALGVNEGVQAVVGAADLQAATLGAGAVRHFDPHLYIGTSSFLICHVPFKKTDLLHNLASLPSPIPDRYLVANEQESAGICLTYLRDNVFFPQDELAAGPAPVNAYRLFDRLAASVAAGSDKVIFTPWLYGERTPVEDRTVRSGFYNQSLRTTRAHLVRAVLEGVAYNSRWLLGAVESFVKRRLDSIRMIGGGAQSDLWCQTHADVLGRTIRQVKDPVQANARGAAFLASVALGHLTFGDIPSRVRIQKTFEPNPDHRRIYDELFREFVNIYKRNREIYRRLNGAVQGRR